MKLYGEPVVMRKDGSGRFQSVVWRGQPYRIQSVQEVWEWRGKWWTTPGLCGQRRLYSRMSCLTSRGSPVELELYREHGRWMLSRLLD